MFAVISVYNNRKVFQQYLLESLNRQTVPYEFIPVDNTTDKYRSCAEALNDGVARIESDSPYVLFAHQDIRLEGEDWLENTEKKLDALPDLGVAGVAGATKDTRGNLIVVSSVFHGTPSERAGDRRCEKLEPVETVDGCCFIVPREVLSRIPFDETTCDGFHCYEIDYCLCSRQVGLNVYCLPSPVYHLSKGIEQMSPLRILLSLGEFPGDYYRTLKKLLKKHKAGHTTVRTPCGAWSTRYPLLGQRILHAVILASALLRK